MCVHVLMFICTCTSRGTCICTHVHEDVCWCQLSSSRALHLRFWEKVPQWTWDSRWLARPASQWTAKICLYIYINNPPQHWGYRGMCPVFIVGTRDLNSSPHAYMEGILPNEPPSQPHCCFSEPFSSPEQAGSIQALPLSWWSPDPILNFSAPMRCSFQDSPCGLFPEEAGLTGQTLTDLEKVFQRC